MSIMAFGLGVGVGGTGGGGTVYVHIGTPIVTAVNAHTISVQNDSVDIIVSPSSYNVKVELPDDDVVLGSDSGHDIIVEG